MPELEVIWDRDDPLVGEFFSDRWVVQHAIGGAAMGDVYEAEHRLVGNRVALKVLSPLFANHDEAIERFRREATAATRIQHPNLVRIFEVGRTDTGVPFLVMEHLDGEKLDARIEREAPLAPDRAVRIVVQILRALEALHAAGLVHRDVQPENVFLARRWGGLEVVKLMDFGLARFLEGVPSNESVVSSPDLCLGAPAYLSPERARGEPGIDARSDVYAAGVILYELLSGRLPHRGDHHESLLAAVAHGSPPPLADVAPHVSRQLADAVDRAMAHDPEHRYANAGEFLAALPGVPDAIDLEDFQPRRSSEPAPTRPRRRAWFATSAVAAIVVVGALLWFPGSGGARSPFGPSRVVAAKEHRRALELAPVSTLPAIPRVPLSVDTTPPGARVFVDGQFVGLSPFETWMPSDARAHVVRVERPGAPDVERSITLGQPVRLSIGP